MKTEFKPRTEGKVSDQGTACDETCLCTDHYTKENKAAIDAKVPLTGGDRPLAGSWVECTQNDALECTVCGWHS